MTPTEDDPVHPPATSETGYISYLLRMWLRRDSDGRLVWFALLEEPGTRHTESFGDVAGMFLFLQTRMDANTPGHADELEHEG